MLHRAVGLQGRLSKPAELAFSHLALVNCAYGQGEGGLPAESTCAQQPH